MAWSCWNYLTFSKVKLREGRQYSSETGSENSLHSHEEEIQREKSLNADVNQVSLFVLIFFFAACFVLMNNNS
jgi:hypothetical protein